MRNRHLPSLVLLVAGISDTVTAQPSFDCNQVAQGSIAELVCQTTELAELDQTMAAVYRAATLKATNQQPPLLKAEQRGWIKGRDDCWKTEDKVQCVSQSYRARIAELQARYALVEGHGPVRFTCDDNPSKELLVTFYATTPATALAELGDQSALLYQQAAASGALYLGRNESFREHQGKAHVVWGYNAAEMTCNPLQRP